MENSVYLKINEANKVTGLSKYYLRNGCKEGTIPHIKVGKVYYINVPAFLEAIKPSVKNGKEVER